MGYERLEIRTVDTLGWLLTNSRPVNSRQLSLPPRARRPERGLVCHPYPYPYYTRSNRDSP
jgi:hypothetical protein